MTGLDELLERAAGHPLPPTPEQVAADLARGRRSLHRRRSLAVTSSAAAVAAVAVAAVALAGTADQRGQQAVPASPRPQTSTAPAQATPSGPALAPSTGSRTSASTGPVAGPPTAGTDVTYPGGVRVSWPGNAEGFPWVSRSATEQPAQPTDPLVAAARKHLDQRRLGSPLASRWVVPPGAGATSATYEVTWPWREGSREGSVSVLASRGLMDSSIALDVCSAWPQRSVGFSPQGSCRVVQQGGASVVLGRVTFTGVNGAQIQVVNAFTVRPDGTAVRAVASTQSPTQSEATGGVRPLTAPPLTDAQLVSLVLDPGVTATVLR